MRKFNSHPKRRGFTLVELLVVIAIISLLIAIMQPALWKSRELSRQVVCAMNMSTIMKATNFYASENEGFVVGPNWFGNLLQHGWLFSNARMRTREDLATGQLWPFIGQADTFRCPADDLDPTVVLPYHPNNSRYITSYCMNGSPIRYGGKPFNHTTHYWETHLLSEFRSNDVLYWECDERLGYGGWWDGGNYPTEGITRRHYGSTMCGNADGHVDWMTVDEYYVEAYSGTRSRLWNVPQSDRGR